MDQLNKFLILVLALAFVGCGVKGRPLPPLTPPTLGRGEPTYSEATKKKATNKKSYSADDDETEAPEDSK